MLDPGEIKREKL